MAQKRICAHSTDSQPRKMAEKLSAKVDIISGHDIADELIAFARAHNYHLNRSGSAQEEEMEQNMEGICGHASYSTQRSNK